LININNSISSLKNFAILSPVSDNLNFPNYRQKKKNKIFDNNLLENVEEIDGYSMILNKNYFKDNIFFDEKFFMYLENVDLCLRVRKENGELFVIKNSKIHHLGSKAVDEKYSEEVELSRNWHWMWSKFYFNKKHRGIFISFLYGFISLIGNFIKYLILLISLNKRKKIYKMRMLGILNAFLGRKSWYRPEIN